MHPGLLQAIEAGMDGVTRVEQRPITPEEAKRSKEVFAAGGSLPIMPIVQVRGAG